MKPNSYVLESEAECERLEEQCQLRAYNYEDELSDIDFSKITSVLDVGCGSGVVSRYIKKKNPHINISACDISEIRIQGAKNLAKEKNVNGINFFKVEEDLSNINEKFDLIIVRYVIQHLAEPELFLEKLKKRLKENGEIVVIDFSGLLVGLVTKQPFLNKLLNHLLTHFPVDLNAGDSIKTYLERQNFLDIRISTEEFDLSYEDRCLEAAQFALRLGQCSNYLEETFSNFDLDENDLVEHFSNIHGKNKSKKIAFFFVQKFIEELKISGNKYYVKKYVVKAKGS